MAEKKKDGFFKRLFGGKKAGCCDVKIEEVNKEGKGENLEPTQDSGCCSPDNKTAQ